jgi:predicted anti-sigma-YlaC factor YlaD
MSPCWHMKALLAQRADQRLSGLLQRYVELHLSQCAQCRAALESLIALRARLLDLRNSPTASLSPKRQEHINATFTQLIERHKAPPNK